MRKKSCLECAFLHDPEEPGNPVPSASKQLRCDLKNGRNIGKRKMQCYKAVWGPETVDGIPSQEMQELLNEDRGGGCFYFPHRFVSRCVAAATLEARKEKRRTEKYMILAAVIGVLGSIAGVIIGARITTRPQAAAPAPAAVVQSPAPAPNESTPLPVPEVQDGPPG